MTLNAVTCCNLNNKAIANKTIDTEPVKPLKIQSIILINLPLIRMMWYDFLYGMLRVILVVLWCKDLYHLRWK